MEILQYFLMAAIGGLAAFLANRGIAVFNDGFRPIYPEYFEGRIDRKALAATSFAVSFGLAIGFGVSNSMVGMVILGHAILLMTDIIGTWCPETKLGAILSVVFGALWSVLIMVGLTTVSTFFSSLPINITNNLGTVSTCVVATFAIFPAIAVGYQRGIKRGLITAAITAAAFLLVNFVNAQGWLVLGGKAIALNVSGMSLLAGVVTMVVYAAKDKSHDKETNNADVASVFSNNITRIQKNWKILAVMGGLLAAAACLGLMAGDPVSRALIADVGTEGFVVDYASAALVAFTRAIGFVPLVFTTAIVTGVYGVAGCTFVYAIGLGLAATGINPFLGAALAFVLGAAMMVAEVFAMRGVAKLFDKYPGVRYLGDHIRNAMGVVLEVALLVGSMIAANAMVPTFGYIWVMACWCLNKVGKKPVITPLAVGPIAVIGLGIVANLLAVIGVL